VGDHSFPAKQHHDASDVHIRRSLDDHARLIRCGRGRIRSSSRPRESYDGSNRWKQGTTPHSGVRHSRTCGEVHGAPLLSKNYQIHHSAGNTNFGAKSRDVACRVMGCAACFCRTGGARTVPFIPLASNWPTDTLGSRVWADHMVFGVSGARLAGGRGGTTSFRCKSSQLFSRRLMMSSFTGQSSIDSDGGDSGGNVGKKSSEPLPNGVGTWIPLRPEPRSIPLCSESDRKSI
jgi:hypothetical protein